jgi:hypothetical protein
MARIETDPNYTSPTFSRATAATDIVKKEDVQAVAAAFSTHVHDGSGKGLAVALINASAIPDSSITSAKIADGTIATADIATNAVSEKLASYFAAPVFSTTTLNTWVLATSATANTHGSPIRAEFMATLQHTAAGAVFLIGIGVDGAPPAGCGQGTLPSAGLPFIVSGEMYVTPSAASHTFGIYVYLISAGTLSASSGINWSLNLTEQKK